jgi:opacity protein-like surface antigen
MFTKRTLLATSALALIAGSSGQANADGFYVSILGGANFMQDNSGAQGGGLSGTSYKFDPDTGFVIGGAVGLHLDKWLKGTRIEFEASYRHNDVGGSWTNFSVPFFNSSGPVSATMSNFAVMANVWYDIDVGQKWVPYLGGGAGWDQARFNGVFVGSTASFNVERNGFAFQVGGGINYPIQDGVNLGIGYRYFRGPDIKNNIFVGKNNLPASFDNENHAVVVNLTIDTN